MKKMNNKIYIMFAMAMMLMTTVMAVDYPQGSDVILSYNNIASGLPYPYYGDATLLSNYIILAQNYINLLLNGTYANLSIVETDPIYTAKSTELIGNASEGATAYTWGNHASEGYFTSIDNFTGTLTDDKFCTYDSSGTINCTSAGGVTDLTGYFDSINNFTGTLTDSKLCLYDNSGTINCTASLGGYNDSLLWTNATNQQIEINLNTLKISYNDSTIVNDLQTTVSGIISYNDSTVVNDLQTAESLNTLKISYNDSTVVNGLQSTVSGIVSYNDSTQVNTLQTDVLNLNGSVEGRTAYNDSTVVNTLQTDVLNLNASVEAKTYYNDSTQVNTLQSQMTTALGYYTNASNGNTAYTWGDHELENYINGSGSTGFIPMFANADEIEDSIISQDVNGIKIGGGYSAGGISLLNNGSGWFADDLLIGGDLWTVASTSVNGSFLPTVNATYNLGSEDLTWENIYVNSIAVEDMQITGEASFLDNLYADQLRLGIGEGNTYIYFYEAGSATNEYIMWDDASTQWNFSDDVNVVGTLYLNGVTLISYNDSTVVNTLQTDVTNLNASVEGRTAYNDSTQVNQLQADIISHNTSIEARLTAEVDGSITNEIQNIFQTIETSSGFNPVADSPTDALRLYAGSGITVTGDSTTDTVTIANTYTSYNDSTEVNILQTNVGYLQGENTTIYSLLSPKASPTFTGYAIIPAIAGTEINSTNITISGKIQTSSYYNSTLTHGSANTFVTMMDWGNVSIATNGTHICLVGKGKLCVES
jgi:hypothetical protein